MRNLLRLSLAVIILSAIVSCGGDKNKSKEVILDPRKDMTMTRSAHDTAEILRLSQDFLESVKAHNIEAALSRVCMVENNTAYPLTSERRARLEKTLSAFPVEDYVIDELLLYSDSDTEVRYTIEMFKNKPGENRPNTIKGSLNPCRINGTWYLTIASEKVETNFKND